MTSSGPDSKARVEQGTTRSEAELQAEGWQRGFVSDEPRLSEAVETYWETGYDVVLLPVDTRSDYCDECILREPGRYKVIYVRMREGYDPDLDFFE